MVFKNQTNNVNKNIEKYKKTTTLFVCVIILQM